MSGKQLTAQNPLKPLQNSVLCIHSSCIIQSYACQRCIIQSYAFKLQNLVLCLVLVVVICVTRVSVELIPTEIVGNVGGFVVLIVGCVV